MRSFLAALCLTCFLAVPALAAQNQQNQMSALDIHTIIDQANAGSPTAQYQLGLMLLSGVGVTRDPVKAGAWFQRSAIQGVPNAQFELAKLQLAGTAKGGKTAAYKWLVLSAGKNPDRIALRDKVSTDLDPDTVTLIQKQAASWRPQREDPNAATQKK